MLIFIAGKLPCQTEHDSSSHNQDDCCLGAGLCPVWPGDHILGAGGGQEPRAKGWVLRGVLLLLVLPAECLHAGVFLSFHLGGFLQPQHLPQHTQEEAPQQGGPAPPSAKRACLCPGGRHPPVPQLGVRDETCCKRLHPLPDLLSQSGQTRSLNQQVCPA